MSVTTTHAIPIERPARPTPRSTYRTLLRRGLGPDEAANLTAFLCGIPVGSHHWEIREINRLLFLRDLHDAGRFDAGNGTADTEPR